MSSPRPHGELPLVGLRVLVPRGGAIGARLSAAVTERGGDATVAPLIEFVPPRDPRPLASALQRLRSGRFDWLAVTSATTVDVLSEHDATIPDATRVAAVGSATREALLAQGFRVDFVPHEFTAAAMVAEWPTRSGRVLVPQSAIAGHTLVDGLAAHGLRVETVTAYETRRAQLADTIAAQLRSGAFDAVLATSGSVASAIAHHGGHLPEHTVLACIGQSTATAAAAAGLRVDVIADASGADALVTALCTFVQTSHRPHIRPPHTHHPTAQR